MAIFHLSVKTVSRSAGRSATAAAAYRAGVEITDQRTGEVHDYTRKQGVLSTTLVLPKDAPEWASDRGELWNAAEQSENRKNSTVAREFEIALPDELNTEQRERLALSLAREVVDRHQCAADVAIHAPGSEGDQRNHHAHILLTTRRLGPDGLTAKTRELDDLKLGPKEVDRWRARFADLTNQHLKEAGLNIRVDHRSLAAQGIDREPTKHLGPTATAIERRTGEPSKKRRDWREGQAEQQAITERLKAAKASGEQERRQTDQMINVASMDVEAWTYRASELREQLQKQEAQQRQQREALQRRLDAQRQGSTRNTAPAQQQSQNTRFGFLGAVPQVQQAQGKTPQQIREEQAKAKAQPAPVSREAAAWADRLKAMQTTGKEAPLKTGQQEKPAAKVKTKGHSRSSAKLYRPAHEKSRDHGLGR